MPIRRGAQLALPRSAEQVPADARSKLEVRTDDIKITTPRPIRHDVASDNTLNDQPRSSDLSGNHPWGRGWIKGSIEDAVAYSECKRRRRKPPSTWSRLTSGNEARPSAFRAARELTLIVSFHMRRSTAQHPTIVHVMMLGLWRIIKVNYFAATEITSSSSKRAPI